MARDAREIMSREIMGISMKSAGRYIAIHIWLWPGLGLEIMGREKHEIILGRATCAAGQGRASRERGEAAGRVSM